MGNRHETAAGPAPSAIREQLQRMLAQAPFDRSPVLSRFLAHVVDHALSVGGPALKEYAIGLEVFDRPHDFDPRIDTIVRVQARRLRNALTRYYRNHGHNDPILIRMPKGQYGVQATWHSGPEAKSADRAAAGGQSGPAEHTQALLPAARTSLIGRQAEINWLCERLAVKATRLLTITGVGGSGKTRLALAVAGQLRAATHEVLFIDLSLVSARDTLIDMLADVFAVRHTSGQSLLQALVERVRDRVRGDTLLVLDNMEGVLTGADVLGELLDACAQLTILVTSRVALQLYGEHEFPVPPLPVPGSNAPVDSALTRVPSVRLFLARAQAANPHADCGRQLAAVAELCIRLDGLPLAIELVAAQAVALTPRQMLERFGGHLDLPPNPACDAPARQRTLRRTIDWSHELLDPAARCLLRRLAVFAGGFTLEAAQAVADAHDDLGEKLMSGLQTLLAMGMVYFRATSEPPRYAMLETLRTYGLERLDDSGEADAVRKAHAAYCLVLAEEGVDQNLDSSQRQAWLARCDLEQDNFRCALEYLLRCGPDEWALRLGQALFAYWERREKLVEGRRLLQRIMDTVPAGCNATLWAKVATYVAVLAAFQGEHDVALRLYQTLLELYREMGDLKGEASALNALGVMSRFGDREGEAREWFKQALALCRQIGDHSEIAAAISNLAESELKFGHTGQAHALLSEARAMFLQGQDAIPAAWCDNHLGDVARADGDLAGAAAHYRQAQEVFERLGDAWGVARSLTDRGQLALQCGQADEAGELLLDALSAFAALDHQRGMATVVDGLVAYALAVGERELAVKLLAAADSWRRAVGFDARPAEARHRSGAITARATDGIDRPALEALRTAGRRMRHADVNQAVRAVLAAHGHPSL